MAQAMAVVMGFAYDSNVSEFPVRSGPGTTFDLAPFKAQKGVRDLPVLDVQPDAQNTPNDNDKTQVYQWFRLTFPNGQTGWLRAHVIGIYGDFTAFGYGSIAAPTYAYLLTRNMSKVAASPTPSAVSSAADAFAQAAASSKPASSTPSASTSSAANAFAQAAATVKSSGAAPSSTPTAAPSVPAQPKATGDPVAIINSQSQSPTRKGPSTTFDRAIPIARGTHVPILAVQQENVAQKYRWFQLSYQGQQVWMREDNVYYEGDTSQLGLPSDLYPAPMGANRWWVRGFNMPPNIDATLPQHTGWDLGAQTSEPLSCGPNGGLVVQSFQCQKCTPDRPSTLMNGFQLSDPSVLQDPGWGFGYGNFIIVRYTNDLLPPSTRDLLKARGFPGGHLFVMHAHMETRLVEAGANLPGGVQIGTCGNTGNSEAPHLHLEVRASKTPDFQRWALLEKGLMDPVVLYQR